MRGYQTEKKARKKLTAIRYKDTKKEEDLNHNKMRKWVANVDQIMPI